MIEGNAMMLSRRARTNTGATVVLHPTDFKLNSLLRASRTNQRRAHNDNHLAGPRVAAKRATRA